jgi:anaerobic selenocysteine-containing dehydrogenase
MVRFGGRLEVVTWDYAIDLVARVVKGVIDKWGVENPRWGKEGHAIFAHRMDHGGGGGGAMIENVTAGLFFFYGVRTAFARIHNRSFFGPENPAIGDAGPAVTQAITQTVTRTETVAVTPPPPALTYPR